MKRVQMITASAIVMMTMVAGSSCSFMNESQQQLLSVSDQYARSLASCDLSELSENCVDGVIGEDGSWNERLSFTQGKYYEGNNSANAALKIAEGITYEVNVDTVKITEDHGSVVCTFSVPDYEAAVNNSDVRSITDFYQVLYSYDYVIYDYTLEFQRVDGKWLAVDPESVMNDLYRFTEIEYSYGTSMLDRVRGKIWYFGDLSQRGEYYNTNLIDMDIDLAEGTDYSTIYYTVEYEGREIKREYGTYEGYLYADDPNAPTVIIDSEQLLEEGEYTITFYDEYGSVLISDVAHVYVYE